MKSHSRMVAGITVFLTVLLGIPSAQAMATPFTGPSPTPSPSISSNGPSPKQHCRIVLDKIRPGEKFSRVRSRTCADRQESLGINQSLLIMTWYQDAGFGGISAAIEGSGGPCDAGGYGVRDTDAWVWGWSHIISSYKVWNNCYWSLYYTGTNYGGAGSHPAHGGNNYYVGDQFNDQVRSILIWAP